MESYSISVTLFIQPDWNKTQKRVNIDPMRDNLNTVKKKILSELKISSQKTQNFEYCLDYMDILFPLVNEDDFKMMLMDLLQNNEAPIIKMKKIIKKRTKRKYSFDEMGTVAPTFEAHGDGDEADVMALNRPSDKMYTGKEEVLCAFCRVSSHDIASIKTLGPFYGPFKEKTKSFYVHELCAVWTPAVYLDDNSKLKNLIKEIKRCNKTICSYCGTLGGGLGCKHPKGCKKTYHFKCCLNEDLDCQLFHDEFTCLCPDHAERDEDEDPNDDGLDIENLLCRTCGEGCDEDKLIICDVCLHGYHLYCLEPPLDEVPEGDWACSYCHGEKGEHGRSSPTI